MIHHEETTLAEAMPRLKGAEIAAMATKTEEKGGDAKPSFYEEEENLQKLCDFLRSNEGPPVREALLMDKRVHYLKGKGLEVGKGGAIDTCPNIRFHLTGEKLVNFLVEPKKGTKWPKKLPKFSDRAEAIAVCKELCNLQYLLRSEKLGKGELGVSIVAITFRPENLDGRLTYLPLFSFSR